MREILGVKGQKTKQDQFNKQINAEAAKFYENEFVPKLNKDWRKN